MNIGCSSEILMPGKMRAIVTGFVLGALLLAAPAPATAQTDDGAAALKSEIQRLKKGQRAILKKLESIEELLKQRPQFLAAPETAARAPGPPTVTDEFRPVELIVEGAPTLGHGDATVTLIEFTDYQCPFCRRHFAQTMPQLVKDYVETGKLRYVMREFPIQSIHPKAFKAAEAALCAGDQGRYWDMHEAFFADQRKLAPADLKAHAEALGLDVVGFSACLDGGKYAERVRKDLADGVRAGVRGTPSFFLGLTDPADPTKIKAIKSLHGAQPYPVFKQAIDALIAQAAKGS
jgi:protein-disulfide isomerase